jgi:hypothetical protein
MVVVVGYYWVVARLLVPVDDVLILLLVSVPILWVL